MVSDWGKASLGQIADIIDSRHKTPQYTEVGIPMVRVVDVKGGALNLSETKKVSPIDYSDYSKGRDPEVGDLIISRVGSYGNIAYVSDATNRFCLGQNTALIVPKIHWRYLYYQLISPATKAQIEEIVVGAVQKTVSLKNIKLLEIPLPPLAEQKAIAHVLGALDDKIELNRRMNETLESMAQALFKSWFVDFDPVLDNALAADNPIPDELEERAEIRRQALVAGTANRQAAKPFPATFHLTEELGWIPAGWEIKGFGSIAKNVRLPADPTTLHEDTPYVGLEHIDRHSFSLTRWGYAPDVNSQKSRFESTDFLFGKLRPYFHKVCQVQTGGICSTDILVIRSKKDTYRGFVGCQIFEPEFVEYANLRSTGTRMPRASWKDMAKYEMALPTPHLIETFNNFVSPTREKCKRNVEESLTLTALRDTLLPKLISGELRLPAAEKLVEEALA